MINAAYFNYTSQLADSSDSYATRTIAIEVLQELYNVMSLFQAQGDISDLQMVTAPAGTTYSSGALDKSTLPAIFSSASSSSSYYIQGCVYWTFNGSQMGILYTYYRYSSTKRHHIEFFTGDGSNSSSMQVTNYFSYYNYGDVLKFIFGFDGSDGTYFYYSLTDKFDGDTNCFFRVKVNSFVPGETGCYYLYKYETYSNSTSYFYRFNQIIGAEANTDAGTTVGYIFSGSHDFYTDKDYVYPVYVGKSGVGTRGMLRSDIISFYSNNSVTVNDGDIILINSTPYFVLPISTKAVIPLNELN